MQRYVIAYFGGNRKMSPEEGQKHFSKYMGWLSSLGDAAVSPANPLQDTRTIGPDGTEKKGSTSSMSGYTVIRADSLESAIATAKACPFLEIGGSLEVSELAEMPL